MSYPKSRHKEAYELWKSGWSAKRISMQPNMPDRRELREWMKPNYQCDCGYHGWLALRRQEIEVQRSLTPEDEQSLDELEREIEGPEEVLSAGLLKAISDAVGVNISKELTGDLQADMISTAYMILSRVREVLPDIQIKDAFALRQILGVAVQILTAFRPPIETERDEVARIQIDFPEYPRGLEKIENTNSE